MLFDGYKKFIDGILQKINGLGIGVADLEMDHIGYQASSNEDYDRLSIEFGKIGEKISEEVVNGRRVGIYKLHSPLQHHQYTIQAAELIAPKKGQACPTALEHVEFVLKESFDSFLKRYPSIPWDLSAINQSDFPMVKLRLDNHVQVKFHLRSVFGIVHSRID